MLKQNELKSSDVHKRIFSNSASNAAPFREAERQVPLLNLSPASRKGFFESPKHFF